MSGEGSGHGSIRFAYLEGIFLAVFYIGSVI